MLSRRAALLAAAAASSVFVTPAFATETKPFIQDDFAAAQKADKPIFVASMPLGAQPARRRSRS